MEITLNVFDKWITICITTTFIQVMSCQEILLLHKYKVLLDSLTLCLYCPLEVKTGGVKLILYR